MSNKPPNGPSLWSLPDNPYSQPAEEPPAPPPEAPKKPRRGFFKSVLFTFLKLLILIVFVVAGCEIISTQVGDGDLPWLRTVGKSDPSINSLLGENRTEGFSKRMNEIDDALFWEGLQPSLKLLDATAPEMARWVVELHDKKRIVYNFDLPFDHPAYERTVAFQTPLFSTLLLAPGFYDEPDLDKAAILAHEYRHYRQNFPKTMAERGKQLLTLKLFTDPDSNRLEDEAYLYQASFYEAYGEIPLWLQGVLEAKHLGKRVRDWGPDAKTLRRTDCRKRNAATGACE